EEVSICIHHGWENLYTIRRKDHGRRVVRDRHRISRRIVSHLSIRWYIFGTDGAISLRKNREPVGGSIRRRPNEAGVKRSCLNGRGSVTSTAARNGSYRSRLAAGD